MKEHPVCFPYISSESLSPLPFSENNPALIEEKELERDLPFLMQFWNHLISRSFSASKDLARVSADIYRGVRLEIDENESVEIEDDHEVPDEMLKSELESEIKEMMGRIGSGEETEEADCLVPTRKRLSTDSLSTDSDKRPR